MIAMFVIDKQLIVFEQISERVNRFNLSEMFMGESSFGDVLNTHFELMKRADFISIEEKLDDCITTLEEVEQQRVGFR